MEQGFLLFNMAVQIHHKFNIDYTLSGQGISILFIHGLDSDSRIWKSWVTHFSCSHHCINIDLPGHGSSEIQDLNFNFQDICKCIKDLVLQNTSNKIQIVGHSLGAQCATWFQLYYPELVEKLVLISPAGMEVFTRWEIVGLQQMVQLIPGSEALMKLTKDDIIAGQINGCMSMKYMKFYVGLITANPILNELQKVKCPVHLSYGLEDKLIPNKVFHRNLSIKDVYRSAVTRLHSYKGILLKNSGHFSLIDRKEKLIESVDAFIAL